MPCRSRLLSSGNELLYHIEYIRIIILLPAIDGAPAIHGVESRRPVESEIWKDIQGWLGRTLLPEALTVPFLASLLFSKYLHIDKYSV